MAKNRTQAAGGTKSEYAAEPFDWFIEDVWCWDLLFEQETFKGAIFDPCCGEGTALARALAAGYEAFGSDLHDRRPFVADFPFQKLDFLGEEWNCRPGTVDNICFNPPYSYVPGIGVRCIQRALQVTKHKVAALLPTKFMASQERYLLFTGTPLKRIYWYSSRPSMPPGSVLRAGKIERGGGKVDYCCMVWDRDHDGPSTNHFLILPQHLEKQLAKRQTKEAA
jgi:SAM-dependent methyltransferase